MTIKPLELIKPYKVGDLTKGKLGEFFKTAYDAPCGAVITHKQLGKFFVQSEQTIEIQLNETLTTLCGVALKFKEGKVFARIDTLCDKTPNTNYEYHYEIENKEINYILAILNNPDN